MLGLPLSLVTLAWNVWSKDGRLNLAATNCPDKVSYRNRILKPSSSIHSYNLRNSRYNLFVPIVSVVFNIAGLFCGTQLATER